MRDDKPLNLFATGMVLNEVYSERIGQHKKWGEQDHEDGTGPLLVLEDFPQWQNSVAGAMHIESWAKRRCQAADPDTWEKVLTEEWAEAIATRDDQSLREELVQVAAVAVAWVEAIDRRNA